MSYDLVKEGITGLLRGLGFSESAQTFEFKDASSNEYGNTFIFDPRSGVLDEGDSFNSETIVDKFYDTQIWVVSFAFQRSSGRDKVTKDEMHRHRETIIKTLDNPDNYVSYVALQKYQTWEVEDFESYFVLNIALKISDKQTY